MIKASGARNLADILRLVPGFQVANSRGHRPTITYHGLGDEFSRRMQILIDGRSVYGPMFGHVAWSSLALAIEDIDRIEVTRGPNAVTYGANAFLGTINIITRHTAYQNHTMTKAVIGNNDIYDGLLRYGAAISHGDIRLSLGYNSDDGLDNLPDDTQSPYLNIRSDLQLTTKHSLLIQTGFSHANSEEGDPTDPSLPPTFSTVDADFQQIRFLGVVSG